MFEILIGILDIEEKVEDVDNDKENQSALSNRANYQRTESKRQR